MFDWCVFVQFHETPEIKLQQFHYFILWQDGTVGKYKRMENYLFDNYLFKKHLQF